MNTDTENTGRTGWWTPGKIAGVGVGAAVLILALISIFTYMGNLSTGNSLESQLNGVYSDGANYLSSCVTQTEQAADVATANATAFDNVIRDSIAGTGQAGQFNLSTPSGQAGFFPLLVKAYPDLSGQTSAFNKVTTIITGCQTDYRNQQSKVLSEVAAFNSWRLNSWNSLLGSSGFPNGNLSINVRGVPQATGSTALTLMEAPIVNSETSSAYGSGTYNPSNPFAPSASPSTSASH